MASGDACEKGDGVKATGNKDMVMSVVCERSCAAHEDYAEADIVAQPGTHTGELTRCPVSGVVFRVAADNPTVRYKGREFRLCCGGCESKFRANPARFVSS